MNKFRKFIWGNRYRFYITFSTSSAVLSWLLFGLFYDREYLNLQHGGMFLFILLWLTYPVSFVFYERFKDKFNKLK